MTQAPLNIPEEKPPSRSNATFGTSPVLNIESGSEGLGWALGSTYKLLFSKALPIFLVMIIGYLGLRVAANIVPELVKIYFSRSNQEEVIDKDENNKRIETFAIVLRSILRVFIVTIAVFTILQIIGVPITSLVATFSVIAIAVGLGTQSLFKDIVQGLLIISENHLRIDFQNLFQVLVQFLGLISIFHISSDTFGSC